MGAGLAKATRPQHGSAFVRRLNVALPQSCKHQRCELASTPCARRAGAGDCPDARRGVAGRGTMGWTTVARRSGIAPGCRIRSLASSSNDRNCRRAARLSMFLARKITRAKWPEVPAMHPAQIPADAITADLRTQDNALSFWRCGTGEDIEIDDAVLALATGGNRLDKVEVVWIAEDGLVEDGQRIASTKGRTPVQDIADRHVDLQELNYELLGKVAAQVSSAIGAGRYRRVAKADVKRLMEQAIGAGRVKQTELENLLHG